MKCVKLSISLPKSAKKHAEKAARKLARERGMVSPNLSAYVAQLIVNDTKEHKEAA